MFVLPLDQVDGVDTYKHFLLSKSVLEELFECNFRSVTEAVDQQIQNLGQELFVVKILCVWIEAIINQVL
jgi:hypothetical protein